MVPVMGKGRLHVVPVMELVEHSKEIKRAGHLARGAKEQARLNVQHVVDLGSQIELIIYFFLRR